MILLTRHRAESIALARKAMIALGGLWPYLRRHRRLFLKGAAAALIVVGVRLSLPWPLRTLTDQWVTGSAPAGDGVLNSLPSGLDPAIAMGGAFLILLLLFGLADFIERLYFARFSIATVRDLRADAFTAATQVDPRARSAKSGDLVARLVGDTARIKSGMKGFLVHVATNSVVFLGVTIVLFGMDRQLGVIFAAAGAATLIVTFWGTAAIFRRSLKHRKKEGKLADTIQRALRSSPSEAKFARINRSSGDHEASVTRIQGFCTWATYGLYGTAVLASLWVGSSAVEAGRLQAGDMVVFMMYALMMRGPIVRLARQGSRSGKILGSTYRVIRVLVKSRAQRHELKSNRGVGPLREQLRLDAVMVKGKNAHRGHPRLGPIDLQVSAGECIAILGGPGAGKTTLLEILAGLRKVHAGAITLDGIDCQNILTWALDDHIAYVPQSPAWPRRTVRELLDLPESEPGGLTLNGFASRAVKQVTDSLTKGADTRIGVKDLSPGERKLLDVIRSLRRDVSLYLIDDPASGLSPEAAGELIRTITGTNGSATVIVALSQPVEICCFDRVVELSRGQVMFDGRPGQWDGPRQPPHDSEPTLRFESPEAWDLQTGSER